MNFQEICRLYGLGALRESAPVKPGTVAQVWRVATESGEFFIRTLTGPEQGKREWMIYRHLCSRGFRHMPSILTARDGAPMAELDGGWCQVQRFCQGERPDPAGPGVPARMADLAVRLTRALADCPAVAAADRFDLAKVWAQGRKNWPKLGLDLTLEQADRAVERCCQLPARGSQVIHGDLGPWNMLRTENGTIWVIDFGEARMGDPYFDLASALGGMINHTPRKLWDAASGEFLSACGAVDPVRLREQLELWVWRGLAQCAQFAVDSGAHWTKMAARFLEALNWAKENL